MAKTDKNRTISWDEFKRWCFCNSKNLMNETFVIHGATYEWVGFGVVELGIAPDPEKHITVTE